MEPQDQELCNELELLISCKGWAWLVNQARVDLDQQFAEKAQKLLLEGADLEQMRQLAAIRQYVLEGLLELPARRIRELERAEEPRPRVPAGHRRGAHA